MRTTLPRGLLILTALCLSGCSRSAQNLVTLAGSTAFQPFAEKLAEVYLTTHPDAQVNVQGGGSAVGIQAALSGAADVGMADLLDLPPEASSLTSTAVAKDGIAIIVNPGNPVSSLTADEARSIFSGKTASWKEVGGHDATVRIISREEGSGTRRSFDALVLGGDKLASGALFENSNGTVREAVASDPEAISYLSIGLVNERVKAVAFGGIAPSNRNVKNGTYSLSRPVFFLTKGEPSPAARAFIDFVLSPVGQGILEKEGLIAVKE